MELLKPTIKFYKKRTFGEKMSASFDFLKDNLKLFFQLSVYLMLPVAMIASIFMDRYLGFFMDMSALQNNPNALVDYTTLFPFIGNFIGLLIVGFIGNALLISLTFSVLEMYNQRGNLKDIALSELKPLIIRNFKRAAIISLIIFGLMMLYGIIMLVFIAISPYTLFITFPAVFVFMIPLTLLFPVYIFEKESIGTSISKTFKLGFKTWGSLFTILLVMGILVGIIQGVASLPWTVIFVVKTTLTELNPESVPESSIALSIAQYLTSVIMLFFGYVTSIITYLGVAYHYGSASEATESTSVNEELDNFENL